jgi:16S rRNA processing protein RimM
MANLPTGMFVVGKILKPQGLKGEVKIDIITSFPAHFAKLDCLFIEKDKKWQTYSIDSVRLSNRFVFIKFSNINSVDEAVALRNKLLYISKNELTDLSENEFYIHDLIGMKVYDKQETLLGEIIDVETYSSNDVYILKTLNGDERLIPAIKDVVLKVDAKQKIMLIHVMEGLLD